MSRRVALGLGLVALALLAGLVLRRQPAPPGPVVERPPVPPVAVDPEPRPGPPPKPAAVPDEPFIPPGAGKPTSPTPDPAAPDARGRLEGRVLTADGRPAVGTRVTLVPPGRVSRKPTQVVLGKDGRYALPYVAPGKGYRLILFNPELGQSREVKLTIDQTGKVALDDVKLARHAVLDGQVSSRGGGPLAGATVRVIDMPALSLGPHQARATERLATTDADGRFHLEPVQPGNKRVVVTAAGHVQRWLDLRIGDEQLGRTVDVALAPGATLTGRVTLAGQPLADAVVHLDRLRKSDAEPPEQRFARTDAHGDYRITGLDRTARYLVAVHHADLGGTRKLPELLQGSRERLDVEVR